LPLGLRHLMLPPKPRGWRHLTRKMLLGSRRSMQRG
jgi:hypothetical protein